MPWLELDEDEEIPEEELDDDEEVGVEELLVLDEEELLSCEELDEELLDVEVELLELVGGGGVCEELLELVGGGGICEELLEVEDELLELCGWAEELLEDVGLFEDEELLMVCFQVAVMSEV